MFRGETVCKMRIMTVHLAFACNVMDCSLTLYSYFWLFWLCCICCWLCSAKSCEIVFYLCFGVLYFKLVEKNSESVIRVRLFSSVQFSLLIDWVVGETLGTIQQRSSFSLFCRRPLRAILAWAGMSALWCPLSIVSADHNIAHPPRCSKARFKRGCCGAWRARTMQVSVSWQ